MAVERPARAVFLDKDGTLVRDVPYNVDPARIELNVGAGEALRSLARRGYRLILVSNQSGIARGLFPEHALRLVESRIQELLSRSNVVLDGFYYCPHLPRAPIRAYAMDCTCRKPRPGLLRRAAADWRVDLQRSWLVGDILDDVEAGRRAGCRTVLIVNGNETEWRLGPEREPDLVAADLKGAAQLILAREPENTRASNGSIHASHMANRR